MNTTRVTAVLSLVLVTAGVEAQTFSRTYANDANSHAWGVAESPTGDLVVGLPDFVIFKAGFGFASPAAMFDPDTDHCGAPGCGPGLDLVTGLPDFTVFKAYFGFAPGP